MRKLIVGVLVVGCGSSTPPQPSPVHVVVAQTAPPTEKESALELGYIGSTVLVPDAEKTLVASAKVVLACYANEPQAKKIPMAVRVVVEPTGEARTVTLTREEGSGLSRDALACVARALRDSVFAAPGPEGAILIFHLTYHPELAKGQVLGPPRQIVLGPGLGQ
jgi:hypothetical protein